MVWDIYDILMLFTCLLTHDAFLLEFGLVSSKVDVRAVFNDEGISVIIRIAS